MSKSMFQRAAAVVCAGALALAMLAGCASQTNAATQQQSENRQYMTQVNQVMENLQSGLSGFTDAVSRSDVVTMRTQADNALKSLDQLSGITVPDSLKDVQQSYVDGTSSLKEALNSYIQLYTEIESATEAQPFDWSSYDQRLADITAAYNDGIAKLQEGDTKAASME